MNIKLSQALISSLCIAALIVAFLSRSGEAAEFAAFACLMAAAFVYIRNLPALSNVSEDNPKVKSLRSVTVFAVIYSLVLVGCVTALKKGLLDGVIERMTDAQLNTAGKLFMGLALAVPMAVFGNISPKLPFNRYTGLRLPWTVRDEETWVIAHRLLGYCSLPLSILLLVGVPTDMTLDRYVEFWWLGAFILYLGIPGIVSGVFYWRKYLGKM